LIPIVVAYRCSASHKYIHSFPTRRSSDLAFADADSGGADEQEGIGVEIIGTEQFPLQDLILLRGKRSGKITGFWREVFWTNEIRSEEHTSEVPSPDQRVWRHMLDKKSMYQ